MYEDWPTLAEATSKTGISERSFHRMIATSAIRREYRREAGKKPVIVLGSGTGRSACTAHCAPYRRARSTPRQSDATRQGATA
jgi:hypothetical protein